MDKDTDEKVKMAYFNLFAAVITECFVSVSSYRERTERISARRRNFAKNSRGLQIWCDCSENFEYSRLKKKILEFNC